MIERLALEFDGMLGHWMSGRQAQSDIFRIQDFLACRLMAVHRFSHNRYAGIANLPHNRDAGSGQT